MKHIRLYETFNQEDYYVEITPSEYDDYYYDEDNKESFNKIENDFLYKNNFSDYDIYSKRKVSTDMSRYDNYIYITKLIDGYYIVLFPNFSIEPTIYKCDQFEGLKKLLKDKKLI